MPSAGQERLHDGELPDGFTAPMVGRVVLGPNNVCNWAPDDPQPQSSINEFQIDGRCGFPMPESGRPEDDTPSGAYLVPDQLESKIAFRVRSNEIVRPTCYTRGAPIEDGRRRTNKVWVAIIKAGGNEGLIPAFISGYSLPAEECTSEDLDRIAAGKPIE